MTHQRRNILEILKKYEYGEILPRPDSLRFEVLSEKADALDGLALRREIRIHATMNNGRRVSFDMLLYLPQKAQGPVPAFLGLNFKGNHATTSEDDVRPTGTDDPRGCQEGRWCFRECAERGYASATICYHELFRDETGFADSSVFSLFHDKVDMREIGENYTPIGAWAWGLSRGLDCLEAQPEIRQGAVAVHGHSRLGKTALWAGAIDQRFAMVISNDSGCGGGALHRRKYGENLSQHFQSHLDSHVPVWFVNRLG
ncbi:MAG: acetylxylan esterase, partial [Lentisphaeria bacterium]|nr:acetylxylan esterase [Lentisphaeria bacterium]